MNREDFLSEALESGIIDDTFIEKYKKFNMYQDLAMGIMREVHRVCEKNGVEYFLAFGSLLGAVRDGGQIPWDYDVDICVKINQREALIDALNKDLDSNYYFYCPEVDEGCRHTMMRIAPIGYNSEALHVDVFYIVGLPNDEREKRHVQKRFVSLGRIRYLKLVDIKAESQGNKKRYFKLFCGKLACAFFSVEKINNEYELLSHRYPIKQSKKMCTANVHAMVNEWPTEVLDESILLNTREGLFRVPKRYEEFLRIRYGNYRSYLPIADRIKEVLDSYNYLENYCKR